MKEGPTLTNSRLDFKTFPAKLNEHLLNLEAPHVNSFDEMLDYGLASSVKHMLPEEFKTAADERIELRVEEIRITRPKLTLEGTEQKGRFVYPAEVRQLGQSYTGMCTLRVGWKLDGIKKEAINVDVGEVPIMLRSKVCNLHNLTPEEMVARGEHDSDWGGIFLIKGNEKIIRMLMMMRRNYPVSVRRSTWKMRGVNFSDLGVIVRTVREDESSQNNVLHYLNNGTAKLMFSHNKSLSYVPACLILKCLVDYTDEQIFKYLIQGLSKNQYYVSCVQAMMRETHAEGLHTQHDCKEYLGELFRSHFTELSHTATNIAITDFILDQLILIHLNSNTDKFNMLVFMVQKLFQTAEGNYKVENVDSVMMQELLLPGHLYQKVLCDKIVNNLKFAKRLLIKKFEVADVKVTSSLIEQTLRASGSVSRGIHTFLATGNVVSKSGMGLMQNSGLVVMAENINRMRYMSHFRAVHRGSYFTTMRTTEARQLLPDAWGFICPVHTPDGSPCGLLNHLTVNCKISRYPKKEQVNAIPNILIDMGMISIHSNLYDPTIRYFVVFLEGKLVGHIRQADADKIVERLRYLKVEGRIPQMMEIAFIPYKKKGQYPGLFLFVGPARMMRPVINLALNKIEYIGSLEQVYLDIAIKPEESYPGFTTHMEISQTTFLSNLANLIPMPDYNQSPRNMYQCQMAKQTMGTPCLNWPKLAANKLYRLQTPTTPLFRPVHYDNIGLDDFPMGTNAIVAVISYTGYDMEDAMIINKSAYQRGFAYGSIYKSKFVELNGTSYFARSPYMPELVEYLDNDGLPQAGTRLTHGCPMYSYYDTDESKYKVGKMDEREDCIVDSVRFCGDYNENAPRVVCVTIRIPRPASIGDKFASRAGQKGICSQHYPAEDLPFTETGIIPDILFNPHGFPSRMTIAMMIETMAGKSATMHGLAHDATPFRFSEENTAIDHFGRLLEAAGYNYYGTERLYSGIDGREMNAAIFFGVVHYQRLRHMVSDKWQVRASGIVDAVTQQPIKGRKRGGGVRFGEMERDALISHGAAYLLHDRLFHNSDKMNTLICCRCGNVLAPSKKRVIRSEVTGRLKSEPTICLLCGDSAAVKFIDTPYVFKYLATELSAVNINAKIKLRDV